MASYRIEWKQSARKELRRLQKQDIARVLTTVEKLADEPRPAGCRKLAGSADHYRVRIGDIRVIYAVMDGRLVVQIVRVGQRDSVYKR